MELYERILSKQEINKRFITAVHAILYNKLISSKAGLAESLGVKPAKFSEILNNRMNAGIDMIAIMCDFYQVSPDWLLMSRGNSIFRSDELPKYWVDDDDLNKEKPKEKEQNAHEQVNENKVQASSDVAPFMELIRDKDNVIREQAEEIGRLKARIEELERRMGDSASDVQTSSIANVG